MAAQAPRTIAFAVKGPIARGDLPRLCARICALLEEADAAVAVCDVTGTEPDAVTVDALARLQLEARRRGCEVRLQNASDELRDLVALIGLDDVLVDA
jgi:ABC-type transporter Mla MlaB component